MSTVVEPAYELFIGGKRTPGQGEKFTLLNPATNRPLTTASSGNGDDARHAMENAESAFRNSGWAGDDGSKRARALSRLAQLVEGQLDALAELESLNMGKTLREAKGDL
ncbi:MAG: aldehyde dehydrogenase family protein, partial [Thermoplasmata archaeon]|nr:aldehyde dehydrogenase family protein [Thermoplasmata archaeon]